MNGRRTRLVRWTLFSLMIAALAFMVGCDKDDDDDNQTPTPPQTSEYGSETAQQWMTLLLDRIQGESLNPPFASRIIGYTGVTMYEACLGGMSNNVSLAGQLTDLGGLPAVQANTEYHWPAVVNSATSAVLLNLFAAKPNAVTAINAKRDELHAQYAVTVDAELLMRSEAYGASVATAIIAWIANDNYTVAITNCTNYQPTGLPGHWEPTPRNNGAEPLPALLPCWGEMRHFLMADISTECEPGPPPAFSMDEGTPFRTEIDECYGACVNSTDEMLAIANFWADDPGRTPTPPGHWLSILNQIACEHSYDLAKAVEALARLGISQADAFTVCWESKYEYDLIRPITCIRTLYDAAWLPPVNTPNFPEYTSGHSVQSGAASYVLQDFLGAVAFTDHTHDALSLPARSFVDFSTAADEAGISRLYGGIHFRAAIDNGLSQGRCIGEKVAALQFRAHS